MAQIEKAPAAPHGGLRARWATYRAYRSTLHELSNLTDRELADLGMSRAGIRAIALEAHYHG